MQPLLRAARRSDLPAVYRLLRDAFPEAPHLFVPQTERDSTFRFRHARVAEVEGRIVAYVRIFARRMLVGGVPVAAGGIGSVATAPEARGRGLATLLLRDAIGEMEREGRAVSFLFTGIPGFYERLGYRVVRQPYFEASRAEIAAKPTQSAEYHVRAASDDDVPAMLSVYRSTTGGSTGAIVRTERTWRDAMHWLDEEDAFVACDLRGRIVAYLRSRCRGDAHQIVDAMCVSGAEQAIVELVRAVAGKACGCGHAISAIAPEGSALAEALRGLRSTRESSDFRYPMMVRAIDPRMEEAIFSDDINFCHADRI